MAQQNKTDRPMTIQEAYAAASPPLVGIDAACDDDRGRSLLGVVRLGGRVFEGFASKGRGGGQRRRPWQRPDPDPDTALLGNDVRRRACPTCCWRRWPSPCLGTLFGGILAIPFSFLASDNIVPKPRWRSSSAR